MRRLNLWLQALLRVLALLLLLYASVYAAGVARRPTARPLQQPLGAGASYERRIWRTPQRAVVHIVTLDLTQAGVELFVTPPDFPKARLNYAARTTTDFATEFEATVAINASFFEPFRAGAPWSFYPKRGDRVAPVGLAVADGVQISAENGFKHLCLLPERVHIQAAACPNETVAAVAGNELLLKEGNRQPFEMVSYNMKPYPRTAIAADAAGTTVWLIVVDGAQRGYSRGLGLTELTTLALELGASEALNLDGGGSTTLAVNGKRGVQLYNAPIHTWLPMYERPVANHIGVKLPPSAAAR